MKHLIATSAMAMLTLATYAQQNIALNATNFPDEVFRNYVSTNFDTDKDGALSPTEISNAKVVNVLNSGIYSLKGIELLTAVTGLSCGTNHLTYVNLENNTALKGLSCYSNLRDMGLVDYSGFTVTGLDMSRVSNVTGATVVGGKFVPNDGNVVSVSYVYDTKALDKQHAAATFYLHIDRNLVEINATNFPDAKFSEYVSSHFDTNSDGWLSVYEISKAKEIHIYRCLTSIVGLEHFSELELLDCRENSLTSIDVSHNTKLTDLTCSFNQLKSLDVTKNTMLKYLQCSENEFTSLDVTKNTKLVRLYCHTNKIASINLSTLTELRWINCNNNKLTSLDLSHNTKLEYLECSHNSLTSLNLKNNTALTSLDCSNNALQAIDISNNNELPVLECNYNKITSLTVGNNDVLIEIYCMKNELTDVDVRGATSLQKLVIQENHLTYFNAEDYKKLERLNCYYSERDMGNVDFTGFAVEGLDMSRVSNVVGAKIVNGMFVPDNESVTTIRYDYDTRTVAKECYASPFTLKISNSKANALPNPLSTNPSHTIKTLHNGQVVIIRDGVKYDLKGRKL